MHISDSNFERPLPILPWARTFAMALFVFLAISFAIEINLTHLGYHPTVTDDVGRWVTERGHAHTLGKRGMIWTGASRGQLGIDLDVLRDKTKLEPVQLAIDGSSFVPVLQSLADDPAITGTVIVDYQPESIYAVKTKEFGAASIWVRQYEKEKEKEKPFRQTTLSLANVEKMLTELLHEHLSVYSSDANPLLSLQFRILPQAKPEFGLITYPDRSRLADYRSSDFTQGYYRRAARAMGMEVVGNETDIEQRLHAKLATLKSKDPAIFLQGTEYVKQLVDKIEARGGKVIFVEMPTSGLVKATYGKYYPRAQFLDVFERTTGETVLISNETPGLKDFICPDGSHLDQRDRTQFTAELVNALSINKPEQ